MTSETVENSSFVKPGLLDQTETAQRPERFVDADLVHDEFLKVFPEASDHDWECWNRLNTNVTNLEDAVRNSGLSDESQKRIVKHLANAGKFLRFQDDYTILLVGSSRAGKSTLINALQARDLVVVEPRVSTTGTVITISPVSKQGTDGWREEAHIYYHTWGDLVKLVRNLSIVPVYIEDSVTAPEKLDISRTKELMQEHLSDMQQKNPPAEEYIRALEDTIEVFQTFERLDVIPGEPDKPQRTIQLDESGLRELRDICNEQSALNKNKNTKVIPLIDHVDYRINFRAEEEYSLSPAILMDVPGAGALTPRHYRRLREQINSEKTRAFILVTTQNAIAVGIDELLSQIRDALIGNLIDPNDQLRAVRRLLIVVNKADEVETQIGGQQKGEESLSSVAARIHPTFLQQYGKTNVFRETKAQAALIAHLIKQHSEDRNSWLKESDPTPGEEDTFQKRYPVFGKFKPSYYRRAIDLAQTSQDAEDREERVLKWSQVPELSKTLNQFLGANRLQQDYRQAQDYYRQAIQELNTVLFAQLERTLGRPLTHVEYINPTDFIKRVVHDQVSQDRAQIFALPKFTTDAFKRACDQVSNNADDFVDAISRELALVLGEANQQIEKEITSPEFQQTHFGISPDRSRNQKYQNNGVKQALNSTRERIDDYLDSQSSRVVQVVWTKFQDALNTCQVEQVFEGACYKQNYAMELFDEFKKIIAKLRDDYLITCRIAILTRVVSYDAVANIIKEWPNFGSEKPVFGNEELMESALPTIEERISYVRKHFMQAHDCLQKDLPNPLYLLFLRRVLEEMQENKSKILEVAQKLSELHFQHLNDSDKALEKALRAGRNDIESRLLSWQAQWEQYQPFRNNT